MRGGKFSALLFALLLGVPVSPLSAGAGVPTPSTSTLDDASPSSMEDRVEPGLLDDLEPVNPIIVQFHDRVPTEELEALNLDVRYGFESIPAVYATAAPSGVQALASSPAVEYIERADKPIDFDMDTAALATLAREVWDPTADNPNVDGNPAAITVEGETIDGSGVGIAVIDSGIDATHPDLPLEDKVKRSFLATGQGVVEAPYFSPAVPHGTAVAGVAAGTGAASGGELAGAAPGASLYSFAIHHATHDGPEWVIGSSFGNAHDKIMLYPAVAMDWIAEHGDEQDPQIRVVSNAWHCRYAECRETTGPDTVHAELTQALVDQGIAVSWSYGNLDNVWNPEATLPIQGVIGTASTDDQDLGLRNGCLSDFTRPLGESKGHPLEPSTWPDVAAPGSLIETTNALNVGYRAVSPTTMRVPTVDEYRAVSGTSFSAAHVAGVASLMLQANPDLSPAEVEWILEDTATEPPETICGGPYNKGDPTHPTSLANHKVGHGFIDAHSAVQTAIGFDGIPETNETAVEPNDDFLEPGNRNDVDTVAVEDRLYLTGDHGFTTTRPSGDEARVIQGVANEPVTFTTDPFDDPREIGGIDASLWMSVNTERVWQSDDVIGPSILLNVQQVGPNGNVKDGAVLETDWRSGLGDGLATLVETPERPFMQAFESPLSLEAGDRLRVEITVNTRGLAGPGTEVTTFELKFDSKRQPSHVGIGHAAPDAFGTYRACREVAPDGCGWLDADHPSSQLDFDGGNLELRWEGPGGSGVQAVIEQQGYMRCEIPEDQAWGECTVRSHDRFESQRATACKVLPQDGPIRGEGACRHAKP